MEKITCESGLVLTACCGKTTAKYIPVGDICEAPEVTCEDELTPEMLAMYENNDEEGEYDDTSTTEA
jgi:hypothetical protein